MAYGQIYARRLPPVEQKGSIERMKDIQQAIRDPEESPYVDGFGAITAAKLLKESQRPVMYTPRSLAEAASKARLPVPERQEQQVPQQRRVITEEDERILTAQAGGRAAIPQQVENVASRGRHGDTMLMHVNPDELKGLSSLLGPTTTNPDTGLPEAFLWWLPLIGAALGGIATGSWKGAALGGLAGLGGAFMMPGAAAAGAIPGMATGTGTVLPGSMATIGASMPGATAINPAVLAGGIAGGAGTGAAALPAMGSLAPWQQMMLGGTSFQAPAVAGQALAPLAGQATQMQNILGAAKGLGPAADSIYTMGGKQIAPELLQQSGLAPWQAQPLKSQPSFFKQGLNYLTGGEGDQAVKGGTDTDMLGGIEKGIKEWWEPKSKLEKGLHVAGAGAGLAALAQPKQTDFGFQLPIKSVSEFEDLPIPPSREAEKFSEEDLRIWAETGKFPEGKSSFFKETEEAGPVPAFSAAKEGGLLSIIKRQGGSGLSVHPAIISAGPQAVAQEVKKQEYRYPTSYFGNPQTRATTHPLVIDALSQRSDWPSSWGGIGAGGGNDGIPATVVPPFEFPEVTPFRSVTPFSSSTLEDRLTRIGGQPTTPVDFSQVPVEDQFVPSTNIPDIGALSDLFTRYEEAQDDPIVNLVSSQIAGATPAQNGGILGLAVGGIPNIFEGHVQGAGDGMADQIPFRVVPQTPQDIPKAPDMAVLSTDEFVFPADAVSMLGNGSSDAGAKILDNAVKSVRQASIGTPKQITEIDGPKVLGGALTT